MMSAENAVALRRVMLLAEIVQRAAPVLQWDTEKAEVWLPGLKAALQALKDDEDRGAEKAPLDDRPRCFGCSQTVCCCP